MSLKRQPAERKPRRSTRVSTTRGCHLNLQLKGLSALRPQHLRTGLELALCAALAVQGARLVWVLSAPVGPLGQVAVSSSQPRRAQADLAILGVFDPFFRNGAPQGAETASAAAATYALHGVRAGFGGRGSAILSVSGGPQKSLAVGEEIEPGVVLRAVAADHVILARGGAGFRVDFPALQPGAAVVPVMAPPPAPPAPGSAAASVGSAPAIFSGVTFEPRTRPGLPTGFEIQGGGEALRNAGLQPGDLVLSVDGAALTAERARRLPQDLAGAAGAEIRFDRNGQIMTTRIRMTP